MANKSDIIDTNDFLKLVAQDAGYYLKDTKQFYKSFRRVLARVLESGRTVDLYGFLKIYIKEIPAHEAWDGIHKRHYEREASKRIVMKIASNYKNLLDEVEEDFSELEETEQIES